MPVATDDWAVVKTEPLPKSQGTGDPWAVVKTEPAQSAAPAPIAAPKAEEKPAESKLPTLESKRSLAGKAWDWARNLPTGLGGAKGTFGQVFDEAGESISSGWAHTQSDVETSYLPHVVNLLDSLEKKVGTPERTPAQKLRGLGNDDPLRFAIDAYRSADPKQIDQIKDRTWSIRNALIGTGAAGREVADGLATPENTALIFALGETEIPRAVHMLTTLGFAGEQAYDAVRLLREGAAAYQKGDAITAMKDFTAGPTDALFAFFTGVHLVHGVGPAIDDTLSRVVSLDTEKMEAEKPPQEGWRIVGSHPDTGLPVLGNPDQIKSAWNPNASSRALEGWKVYQTVQAGRAARPEKKQEEAAGRAEKTETAKDITEKRDDLHARRVEAQAQPTEGPIRQVDSQIENGHISYRGQVWGEDNSFGVSSNGDGHAVYRKTPRGTEWLDQEGNFVEEPTSLYFNPDPQAADTVARLSSLTATADTLAEQNDSTDEQKKEASELADIRRSLVNGEIDAKEAQKRAGIAEKANVPDEFLAARDGRLNGPFHESSADAFFNDLRQQAEASGMDEAEVERLLDEAPALAREETENNLHHVYRPGDYITSKRGVTWTLDSKGLLHPDDGGSPVPLMKKGRYSNQSMQLAASGRVGYGTKTREQRRIDRVRDRDIAKALEDQQEAARREMLLAKQQEGLETAPETLPREDEAAKQERRARLLSRPPRAPESAVGQIVREVFRARPGVTDVLQSIADKKGVSVEDVMRQQLASDPERANTVEAKIARLEAGDEISDQFRKDRPWKVEEQNGKLFIRSGQAAPLSLDRLNPSDRVKQIVARGQIKSVAPEFEGWDATRAAFESAHVIHQQKLTEEVRERAAGNVKDPEPRTPKQAGRQAQAATRRANAAEAVATKALIDSLSPTTTDVEKAVADVEKAQREVKTAEEGYAQQITAQGKTITEEPFPPRADISIGLKGKSGVIVQNNREIPFHYELVPVPSVQASHIWQGNKLVVNPVFPDALQPRTISETQSQQLALWAAQGNYDFRQYADKTINGSAGPTIIEPGGFPAGGNTRWNLLMKHLQNLESITDLDQRDAAVAGFRSAMRELAQEVGIRRYPDDTENYAVVRVLDKPISNIRDAADLGRLFNKSVSVQITKSAKGISYSKSFDNPLLEDIGRRVEAYDGIVPAMQADPEFFRDIVTNRFGIVPEEEADWFEEKPGRGKVLTDQGRDQFTKALLGTVVDNPSILNRIEGKTPYRALERALGYVVKMKALPDFDITSKINEALAASAETATTDPQIHSSKDPWKATYQPQQAELSGMETDIPPEPDRMTEALWRALHSSDAAVPRVFNDRLKAYLGEETSKGGWMFGEHTETPVQAFNRAFSRQLREVSESRGDKKDELTQEEFDAALRNREFSDQEREEAESRQNGGRGESSERRRPETQRLRKRIDQMTADEMREALLTSRKTGLPNRTDFEERNDPAFGGTPAPIVGMSDVDGLKAFNDTYGYAAGDKLLKAKADALRQVGVEAYHDKGDEFLYRAETTDSLRDKLEQAREILRKAEIEVTKDGKTDKYRGVDFSFGVGRDLADAEANQKTAKAERTAKGERERGKFGNIKISPPPKPPTPADMLRVEKDIKGFVTPAELKTFLSENPATKDHASELMRTAQIMAEYIYDADPPVGVDRKEALAWIMKERLAGIEAGELKSKRGEYSDPNIEVGTGILKLHKAADPTTFIHEFAHVIFPMLSDDDMRAIATIEKAGDAQWDGTRKGMTPEVYTSMTEKLANGLEKFLRDQNPKDFNAEVKAVLAKVKEIFRKIYLAFKGDPLAPYTLSSDAIEMFDKMFHITGSDVPDEWRAEVKKAKAEEKKIGKPEEAPHPLQKIARDMGGIGLRETVEGRVVDSIGDRVDPKKPTATVMFKSEDDATSAYTGIINGDSKIEHAELLETPDGKFGIKFNTATKVPKDILFQALPEKHPGLRLEDLEKRLAGTPTYKLMERKLLQLQIDTLKRDIRGQKGVTEPQPESTPEIPKQALQEAKNGKTGNGVRKVSDGVPGDKKPQGIGRIPQPPQPNGPRDAATGGQRGGAGRSAVAREPASLENVKPVNVLPLKTERGAPVGTIKGEKFDSKIWTEGLKRAGLPENAPPPTVGLSRAVADKLKFPGQKQSAQIALSALEQGDGVVLANATGTGKTYLATGIIKEYQSEHPNSRILYVTKNRTLKEKTKNVATNTFGFEIDTDVPKDIAQTGAWAVSYVGMMNDAIYKQMDWDLVIADESGEARNWFKEDNQQGKMLKQVIEGSKKAVYLSATPFHSPMEYGYLDKLNLWPKGGFDRWIQENFAHEKIGDKIVARLDPSKQAKLRQQLIERGQMVSQAISYDGYTAHFGVVPVTDQMKRGLDRIREGFARAQSQLLRLGKKGAAQKAAAFEATYTKAFLERERLPQAIQLAKKAMDQGWQVIVFSEHSAEDLFRRPRSSDVEPSTYQELDDAMGGELSKIIPPFPDAYDELRSVFGSKIGDYSGRGNTMAERKKALLDFQKGDTPMLYTTYAAGGIGVDMHDADFPDLGIKGGDKPRLSIYLGPPYSGVLLEQAMGRTWRFGVKSDTHSVFLASDSEPDIRLMTTKVGPRMRALRAAVLGERDSLAQVMATYTDDEKVRQRQDMLAYSEGDEEKVSAARFQVRSKSRQVGINDWSAIIFPSADFAKHKGMKYGEDVPGGDWSNLYQSKFGIYEPPNPEKANTDKAIEGIADEAAKNPDIPTADIGLGAAKAEETAELSPDGIDKAAAGAYAMKAALNAHGFVYDPATGKWDAPFGIVRQMLGDDVTGIDERERDFKRYPLATLGMGFEQRAIAAGREIKAEPQVRNVLNLVSDYFQADEKYNGPLVLGLVDIFNDAGINIHDSDLVREVIDVQEGRRSSADERVNKAAAALSGYYDDEREMMAKKGVHRADGGTFADVKRNPRYVPHFTDWDMKLTDPSTGKTKTLREITDDLTLDDSAKLKYFERTRQELGADTKTVNQWLDEVKQDRLRRLRGPKNGTVTEARILNHPFYHKDFYALVRHAKEVSSAMALEDSFGYDFSRFDESLKKVPNRQLRTDLRSNVATVFEHQDWSTRVGKLVRLGQGFEAITKMTLSPLSVATHQIHALMGLKMGFRGLKYQALANYRFIRDPGGFMREKYYMGVVSMKQNPFLLEGERRGIAGRYFDLSGFSGLYRWTRGIVGETANAWMELDSLSDLKKGGRKEAESRRLLKNTMLISDKAIDEAIANNKWDEDSLGRAQRAFTDKIAYSENPNQMPKTARMSMAEGLTDAEKNFHAAARGMYMLQSFSIKTYSMLKDTLYDEVVVHKNFKPLAPFLILYPLAGVALMAAKAGSIGGFHRAAEKVQGRQHQKDRWDTFLDEFSDIEKHPWVGSLKFYLDSLCTITGMERTKRWADIGMQAAMGNAKKVEGEARYFATDETEQAVGGLYSDLFWVAATQGQAAADYLHTKLQVKKWPAFMRDEVRELEQLMPFIKVIPKVEGIAHPPKRAEDSTPRYF